jgi:trans-2,3-dihydro-3-hydroxyanthranilate isomerase
MRRLPYVLADVFASRPLEGNQLAVFTDGRSLNDGEMQAVAREMRLCETTFVLPSDAAEERAHGTRVRIFTVGEEIPFAGHPTLGTAAVVRGTSGAAEIQLRLGVGALPVAFRDDLQGTFGEMRQRDPEFGQKHEPGAVARAAGLAPEAIAGDLPIQTVSTGLPFIIVPVRDLPAIRNLRFQWSLAAEYLERSDGKFFYFVSRETADPAARLHARMLFYGGEDPATGSAAGCCAAWAVAHGVIASEESAMLEQGLECQRPSQIFVRARRDADRIVNVRVGGYVVETGRGELFL